MLLTNLAAPIAALSLSFGAVTAAYGGTLIPVPQVPNSMETDVFGVNDNNVVTGAYIDEQFVEHGFAGTLDGQYTFFDYDKGSDTLGLAVNKDGVVFGWAFQRQPPGLEFQFLRYLMGRWLPPP